ncbi:hypothetical protein [Burkholderia sp. IDO3]|uniref:hypothetical protein n=1 Tax=Burkholderia sp. IDO3 TaxID=1705310 RepID=UPI000BBAF73C|nr:hypothetical protein [Burkholderia sp. IDO3]AXK61784.1 hypothetical protein DCN14_03305 [Burkholderia sp. IDO3]PCD62967.1 hypothetical protein CN645_04150 [Burkholderia sp. IDO3]
MKRMRDFDYLPKRRMLAPLACLLLIAALCGGVWTANERSVVRNLDNEMEQFRVRVDNRQRIVNRARRDARDAQQRTAESDRKAPMTAVGEMPMLLDIEHAWTPKLALLSLAMSTKDGREQARIDGLAANLTEVYAFVARLRHGAGGEKPGVRVTLLQHGIKMVEQYPLASFSLSVEAR